MRYSLDQRLRLGEIGPGVFTHTPEYRPEESNDRELVSQIGTAIPQEFLTGRLQSSSHPHKAIDVRSLHRLEKSTDAQ